MSNKPPLGPIPKPVHDHHRARELAACIAEYLACSGRPPLVVVEWANELCVRIEGAREGIYPTHYCAEHTALKEGDDE